MGRKRIAALLLIVCVAGQLGLPTAGADSTASGLRGTQRSPITSDLDLRDDFETFHRQAGTSARAWLGATRAARGSGILSPSDVTQVSERRRLARRTGRLLARMEHVENRFRRLRADATGLSAAARSCRVLTLADDYATLRARIERATRSLLLSGRLQLRLDVAIDLGDRAEAADLRTARDVVERSWRARRMRVVRLNQSIRASHRILAQCLADAAGVCAGSAVPLGRNLVANPGAEDQRGGTSATDAPQPTGWSAPAGMEPGVIVYGTGGYPTTAPGGGTNFFSGAAESRARMSQQFEVCSLADRIDEGGVVADVSALLGGFSTQSDRASVVVTFADGADGRLGVATLGPVTPADRADQTTMVARSQRVEVPAGTRSMTVAVVFERASGISNDGYADNISVVLTAAGA